MSSNKSTGRPVLGKGKQQGGTTVPRRKKADTAVGKNRFMLLRRRNKHDMAVLMVITVGFTS